MKYMTTVRTRWGKMSAATLGLMALAFSAMPAWAQSSASALAGSAQEEVDGAKPLILGLLVAVIGISVLFLVASLIKRGTGGR